MIPFVYGFWKKHKLFYYYLNETKTKITIQQIEYNLCHKENGEFLSSFNVATGDLKWSMKTINYSRTLELIGWPRLMLQFV